MRTTRLVPAVLAALVAALLSALALAPTASAVEPRPGDGGPQPIIGGGYAQNAPWAARLFSNGAQTCTSTIISPTWILTAKHCVSGGNVAFRIGSLDQGSGGTVANGVQTVTSPSADLALVRLDRSVSATYAQLGRPGTVRVGQTVQVYGWGATSRCGSEINCQSQYLKVADVSVTQGCYDAYYGQAICARPINGITAGGDSGGPMTAGGVQVGVASTSDRQSTTAYTNVTAYRSWIQSVAGV